MIRVLFFAHLRTAAGTASVEIDERHAPTGEALWSHLVAKHPALAPIRPTVRLAVNDGFAPFSVSLKSGDEVAFIPPVSGG